jgi:tetratricopeptide (TPR) repeat protein
VQCKCQYVIIWAVTLLLTGSGIRADKELMYDPEKGIIFIEKNEAAKNAGVEKSESASSEQKKPKRPVRKRETSGIHIGRKKDPPELYFKSGLEYYKNGDFKNALKNFRFADSLKHSPEYTLWIGKTYRKLADVAAMLKTMFTIIKDDSDSDVADDALFELAVHYKMADDYEKATHLFTQLIEQYPFGLSCSTGDELREIAREQRRNMRAEMINLLSILGFIGDDLPGSFRRFQKANNLPVTEVGDHATITAIKKQYQEYLAKEEVKALQEQHFEHYRIWIYVIIIAGAVNVILLIVLMTRIRARKRHVEELQKIVTDLDTAKI